MILNKNLKSFKYIGGFGLSKFDKYIEKLIEDTPDFMRIEKDDGIYLLLDYVVTSISSNAMAWLFKVYLDKNYNIIVEDKLTKHIKEKYSDRELNIINLNGNLFLNKAVIGVILEELEISNQGEYNKEELTFSLK